MDEGLVNSEEKMILKEMAKEDEVDELIQIVKETTIEQDVEKLLESINNLLKNEGLVEGISLILKESGMWDQVYGIIDGISVIIDTIVGPETQRFIADYLHDENSRKSIVLLIGRVRSLIDTIPTLVPLVTQLVAQEEMKDLLGSIITIVYRVLDIINALLPLVSRIVTRDDLSKLIFRFIGMITPLITGVARTIGED